MSSNSIKIRNIDASNLRDHFHLNENDHCGFLYEKTARNGAPYDRTDSIIANIKKKPSESHKPGYHYKRSAINELSCVLKGALNKDALGRITLVPVPGSKIQGHPDFDDRLEQIARGISPNLDLRCLVQQSESYSASHEAGDQRIKLEELLDLYSIDEKLAEPTPNEIVIFDDVLTAGTHFRAMHTVLSNRFPDAQFHGLFIARRVIPNDLEPIEEF